MLCSNMWKKQLKDLNKVYVHVCMCACVRVCVYVCFNILFDSNNILNIEYVNIFNICYNK